MRAGPSCSTWYGVSPRKSSCPSPSAAASAPSTMPRGSIQAGAEKVSINSSAVKTPEVDHADRRQIRQLRHRRQHRSAACATRRPDGVGGPCQRRPRADGAGSGGLGASAWKNSGPGEIVLTSMDADGTKAGYDLEMTLAVSEAVSIPVVASGGAGSPEHLYQILSVGKADAALAASIFHYNEYGIRATKEIPCPARRADTFDVMRRLRLGVRMAPMRTLSCKRRIRRPSMSAPAAAPTNGEVIKIPEERRREKDRRGSQRTGSQKALPHGHEAASVRLASEGRPTAHDASARRHPPHRDAAPHPGRHGAALLSEL